MSANKVVVEARSLIKNFDQKSVVDGIHFAIREGECYGFLGPNGAGKSSTLRMMYCSSPISSGELFVLGLNVRSSASEIKRRIGVVPQEDGLDPDFSVLDNLIIFGDYHGMTAEHARDSAKKLIQFMNLEEYVHERVEVMSGGMRRRLAIARSLINNPELLVLDEPTVGLDPQARLWIWDRLSDLKKQGTTLVLTTHYMDEAERICDRIAIMDKGLILAEDSPRNLIDLHVGHEVVEFECAREDANYLVGRIKKEFEYQILPQQVRLFIKTGQQGKDALNLVATDSVTIRRATLEDVFLKLTGHQLKE